MQKTIIAIWGVSKSGKSSVLKKTINILKENATDFVILIDGTDKKAIIKFGKIIIGIETQGDPGGRQENSLKEFVDKYECDIILCASRTYGSTVYSIDTYKDAYRILWTTNIVENVNTTEDKIKKLNNLKAKQLVELVDSILDESI